MDFATRIRTLRKDRGLTQEQLARRADVNINVVGMLERRVTLDPHYSNLKKIANGLDLSVLEFLSVEED